jgi:hypothetical protein
METEKGLMRTSEVRLPKFVQDAYDTIEGMEQFAKMLLASKLVPDHFYEKGVDNKPDYTKGKVSAVVVVLLQAQQLQIPPMTALQHVIPVNGLLSIKGDLAKTMIFASGKLRKDSWVETVTGSIEEETMVVTITATRDDNGLTLTRTFSVDKAKRMGLWVTNTMVNGTDGWKYKKSAWFKTPDRMLNYRALGNIARDLFSDVLLNMYTTEEAVDIQRETIEVIETESGAKITIPDKEHTARRAEKMTSRVADKIKTEGFSPVDVVVMPPTVINESEIERKQSEAIANSILKEVELSKAKEEPPFIPTRESFQGFNGEIKKVGETTINLEGLDTARLLEIINADMDMMEAMQMIPGKNTNKKLRGIVEAHQGGILTEYVAGLLPPPEEEIKAPEIPVNKEFEKQGTVIQQNLDILEPDKPKEVVSTNKYGIIVPEYDKENKRDFSVCKVLFNKMMGITPQITTPVYMDLAAKLGMLAKYKDKEIFCREATVEEINLLLDSN